MLLTIFNALTGNVFNKLVSVYEAKLNADNDAKKLAADLAEKQIVADMEARTNAKEIRLATSGFWEMRLITFLIAAPFVAHLWAVTYDTLDTSVYLGIPALPKPFSDYQGAILLSFFGVQVASKGLDVLAYIFGRRK